MLKMYVDENLLKTSSNTKNNVRTDCDSLADDDGVIRSKFLQIVEDMSKQRNESLKYARYDNSDKVNEIKQENFMGLEIQHSPFVQIKLGPGGQNPEIEVDISEKTTVLEYINNDGNIDETDSDDNIGKEIDSMPGPAKAEELDNTDISKEDTDISNNKYIIRTVNKRIGIKRNVGPGVSREGYYDYYVYNQYITDDGQDVMIRKDFQGQYICVEASSYSLAEKLHIRREGDNVEFYIKNENEFIKISEISDCNQNQFDIYCGHDNCRMLRWIDLYKKVDSELENYLNSINQKENVKDLINNWMNDPVKIIQIIGKLNITEISNTEVIKNLINEWMSDLTNLAQFSNIVKGESDEKEQIEKFVLELKKNSQFLNSLNNEIEKVKKKKEAEEEIRKEEERKLGDVNNDGKLNEDDVNLLNLFIEEQEHINQNYDKEIENNINSILRPNSESVVIPGRSGGNADKGIQERLKGFHVEYADFNSDGVIDKTDVTALKARIEKIKIETEKNKIKNIVNKAKENIGDFFYNTFRSYEKNADDEMIKIYKDKYKEQVNDLPKQDRDLIISSFLEPIILKQKESMITELNTVENDFKKGVEFVNSIIKTACTGLVKNAPVKITGENGEKYEIKYLLSYSLGGATVAAANVMCSGKKITTLLFTEDSTEDFVKALKNLAKNQTSQAISNCINEFTQSKAVGKMAEYGMKYMFAVYEQDQQVKEKDMKELAKSIGSDLRNEIISLLQKVYGNNFDDIMKYIMNLVNATNDIDSGKLEEMSINELSKVYDIYSDWIWDLPKQ